MVALRKDDLQVLDTWHTLGLRGTGSHDSVADEVFVPADRVFSMFDGPMSTGRCIASRCSGSSLCRSPRPRWAMRAARSTTSSSWPARRRGWVDPHAGRAPRDPSGGGDRRVGAGRARALYYQAIEAAWQASQDGEPVPVEARNRLRLAATHGVRTSADVVRDMYDLAGGSAIYDDAPLQRRFRDAYTATAHFQVNEASRELPGRILLDQPADVSML